MKIVLRRSAAESVKYSPSRLLRTRQIWTYVLLTIVSMVAGMVIVRSGLISRFINRVLDLPGFPAETVASTIGTVNEEAQAFVQEAAQELENEILSYNSNGLATLFLDIPFESYQALESKRAEALRMGILLASDDDFVPASIRFMNEQSMSVDIRLKGDWTDHLENQWSFRIHIEDNAGAIFGMRSFSVQAPGTRNYVNEWAYHQTLFLEDLLTTRYHFVNMVINGKPAGIYALEEHFTADLLESQGRRAGVILRLDEDPLWQNRARLLPDNNWTVYTIANEIGIFNDINAQNSPIKPFGEGSIAKSEDLTRQMEDASENLHAFLQGVLLPQQVLDEKAWGKFFAVTDLWGAGHSTIWHNLRMYYNPITGLIEPVAFDANPQPAGNALTTPASFFVSSKFFITVDVQKEYIQTLERIANRDYLSALRTQIGQETEFYTDLLNKEGKALSQLVLPWNTLSTRARVLMLNLDPSQSIQGHYEIAQGVKEDKVMLYLTNRSLLPLKLESFGTDEQQRKLLSTWCVLPSCGGLLYDDPNEVILLSSQYFEDSKYKFSPAVFEIPADVAKNAAQNRSDLVLRVRLNGSSRVVSVPVPYNSWSSGESSASRPEATLRGALDSHPFLRQTGPDTLSILPGDWQVSGDLVLPAGFHLAVQQGTTLRFQKDAIFLSNGKTDLMGSEDKPVYLTAQGDDWGGVLIFGSDRESRWEHVVVDKTTGIERDGWMLTGGITFYESPVWIQYSSIGHNFGEDALNLVRSRFTLNQVEFLYTYSDAFDGDFVDGLVKNCSFHNITGDGLDLNGSEVRVNNSTFTQIEDKAISAGENSHITINNSKFTDINIGVASKDLSRVSLGSSTIDTAREVALAVYIKKQQYGPASITASDVEILNTDKVGLCQMGSSLLIDDKPWGCEQLDIQKLYDDGVLGN